MNAQEMAAALNAGRTLYGRDRYQEALPYFTQVIEADPVNAAAWAGRGMSHLYLRELEPALRDVEQSLTLLEPEPDGSDRSIRLMLLYSRALALDGLHRSAESRAAFAAAAAVSRLPQDGYKRWGDLARMAGQREEALAAYRQAINDSASGAFSRDISISVDVAQSLMDLGDYAAALDAAQQVVERFPERVAGWKVKARALLGLGRYRESLLSADQGLTIDGQDSYAWGVKGAALQGLKRYREAQAAYHESYTLGFTNTTRRSLAFHGDLQMLVRTWQLRAAWRLVNMEMGQRLLERQAHREG